MVQYISIRTIFNIAVVEEKRPGSPVSMLWWEQYGVRFGNEGRVADESEVDR